LNIQLVRKEAVGDEEIKPKRFFEEDGPGSCGVGHGRAERKNGLWAVKTPNKNWGCHLIDRIDGP
jgi:hypothetical protein